MRCLDCGNKAKKDCLYYRCRSCCKGHAFRCRTHIKSTWVPISTRQAVRNLAASYATPPHNDDHQQEQQQQQQLCIPTSSGFGGPFPTEVSGEATFTCVRVPTSEGNPVVDQYAYETSINIGGHLFKGLLYDEGPHRPVVNSRDMDADAGDPQKSTINIAPS